MDLFTQNDLKTLLTEHPSPCVSVFMPAHPGGSEQDPVRWRKHLTEAEEQLVKTGWRTAQVKDFLAPARRLVEDIAFWKNQSEGLAAFLSTQFLRLFRLPLAFKDQVVVTNRFMVLPLLPLLSDNGKFFILALSQKAVRLLQGDRHGVGEVDLTGVPQNLAEALLSHEAQQPFSFFGRRAGEGAGSWGGIFHGHGVGIDDTKEELLHYFQKIDRGLHTLLHDEKAPLVLAAVDSHQPVYRQANGYPHLLEKGIEGNPDRLSNRELRERAWPLVKQLSEQAQQRAAAQYRQLAGTGRASADLQEIDAAAHEGRVQTLFVALGRQVWGVFDPSTGRLERHEQASFGIVDLIDLAAADTLAHGGTVYAVEAEQVPSGTDIAAIFSLPLPKHGKRS